MYAGAAAPSPPFRWLPLLLLLLPLTGPGTANEGSAADSCRCDQTWDTMPIAAKRFREKLEYWEPCGELVRFTFFRKKHHRLCGLKDTSWVQNLMDTFPEKNRALLEGKEAQSPSPGPTSASTHLVPKATLWTPRSRVMDGSLGTQQEPGAPSTAAGHLTAPGTWEQSPHLARIHGTAGIAPKVSEGVPGPGQAKEGSMQPVWVSLLSGLLIGAAFTSVVCWRRRRRRRQGQEQRHPGPAAAADPDGPAVELFCRPPSEET